MKSALYQVRYYVAIFLLTLTISTVFAATSEAELRTPDFKALEVAIFDGNRDITEPMTGKEYDIVFYVKKERGFIKHPDRDYEAEITIQVGDEEPLVGYQSFRTKGLKKYKRKYTFEQPGTYTIRAEVNTAEEGSEDFIEETNYDNNTAELIVTVTPTDLRAYELTIEEHDGDDGWPNDGELEEGHYARIKFEAINESDNDLKNVQMKIEVEGPKNFRKKKKRDFSPGGIEEVKMTKKFKRTGDYTVRGIVDSKYKVTETNEGNNEIVKTLTIVPASD